MAATAGVVACTGVATVALIIRRDGVAPRSVASPADSTLAGELPSTNYLPDGGETTTTAVAFEQVHAWMVWEALSSAQTDPSGAALNIQRPSLDPSTAEVMPTADQFGCTTPVCQAMFTYVVWHEIARRLGFADVYEMQAANPTVDFSVPPVEGQELQTAMFSGPTVSTTILNGNETATTVSIFEGVILLDAGAPAGAMEDAYQRLAGYDRTIVPSTGKASEQTMVMPIGGNGPMASSVGGLLGIDGFDTWDPSYLGSPIQGMVAVVIGADYWDRVQGAPATSTTNVVVEPTAFSATTSIGA